MKDMDLTGSGGTFSHQVESEIRNPVYPQKLKTEVNTVFSITLSGLVQGIGFRPYIFQLAKKWNLRGTVSNGPLGVHIHISANAQTAEDFLAEILCNPPAHARITASELTKVIFSDYEKFTVIDSSRNEPGVSVSLTPDLAMCEICRHELHDPANRRFRYPFITCTHCGPRYSIIRKLPYDRVNSSMADFTMCPECYSEYENPENRRFYSQTNSCKTCGPRLAWHESKHGKFEHVSVENQQKILAAVNDALIKGKIVAIKAIGGYLLICDATSEPVIKTLRERKHRPAKPFAVLYPDLEKLHQDAHVTDYESAQLQSPASPIVLVKRKKGDHSSIATSVAPGLDLLGVMLPYSPLLEIIANDFRKPLVATSGNVSNNPITFQDKKALEGLVGVADFILTNSREIITPQDDSVVRFSALHQKKITLRRSRGLSPDLAISQNRLPSAAYKIAFGSSAKSTFCIQNGNEKYISQYQGDLENYDNQESFRHSMNNLNNISGHSAEAQGSNAVFLCDLHPGYFSTLMAEEYAAKFHVKPTKIQHHKAHFFAVLGENNLSSQHENVLGVIWDGTGYGTDGMVWGGEFFYQNHRLHFPYFDSLLGDKMAREPRLSALSLLASFSKMPFPSFLKNKFTETEWTYLQKVIASNTLKTCSIGRLFDAVASLTGLIDKARFEGEAALLLEQEAQRYFDTNGYDFPESYFAKSEMLVDAITADIQAEKETGWIAAKFHYSLVKYTEQIAEQMGAKKLAFSGGVFQNALLVDLFIEQLSAKFELYFHEQLSPNDENISYGQLICNNADKALDEQPPNPPSGKPD